MNTFVFPMCFRAKLFASYKIQAQHMLHYLKLGGLGDVVTLLKQISLDGDQ